MATLSDFTQLLREVAIGNVTPEVQVEIALDWLSALEQSNPFIYAMVVGFVSAPPKAAITALAAFDRKVEPYVDNVQALRLVELLQGRIR